MTTTTDPERGEATFTRDFDAPRELIWSALVDPKQLVRFWGPVGTSVPLDSVTIEPWPGGRFEATMVADDGSGGYPMICRFVEVVEPELFVYTELGSGMVTPSTLTDLGDGTTRLVIHQTNTPQDYLTPEALAGFNTSLDRLAGYLATL